MPFTQNRRHFLKALALSAATCASFIAPEAVARRRVRLSGRGIAAGSNYKGPVLSREQLRTCVTQERSVNSAMDRLDRDEAGIERQKAAVDNYSQESVDAFNSLVDHFNAEGRRVNGQIQEFNTNCANRVYYESDMRAVESGLATRK